MIKEFLTREDLRRNSVSGPELERRWKAIRERMQARKVDYLIIQAQQRYVGGYFRWFTDEPAGNYMSTAIFPLADNMTILEHGAPAIKSVSPSGWESRGVKEIITIPSFPNVCWVDAWYAEKVVEVVMRTKPKTVGLVGLGNMSAALYADLMKGLNGVNIVNASDLVDEVRMIKSEEELRLHREAAYMHELSYQVAKKAIRPGANPMDVVNEIQHAQILAGSEEQQVSFNFGKLGGPRYRVGKVGTDRSRRKLKYGDIVNLGAVESSAAGGYWYDLRRFLCIGSIPSEIEEAYGIVKEARAIMAANSKPGVLPGVALEASDAFLRSKGCPPEARVGGHGQGLDLVERPIFHRSESAKLEVGMVVSLHPTAQTKFATASIADTYVITDSGAVPMYESLFNDNEIVLIT